MWWIIGAIAFSLLMYYIGKCIEKAHEIDEEELQCDYDDIIVWEEKEDLSGKKYYIPKKQKKDDETGR